MRAAHGDREDTAPARRGRSGAHDGAAPAPTGSAAIGSEPTQAGDDGPALWLSVLGPLRLVVDGQPVEVPGPKRRATLAMLAMASPGSVSAEQLVDAVWPGEPPQSGRAALQSHVSRLRRHLGPHAGRLTSTDAGYRLDLDVDELDALRFDELVRAARSTASTDPHSASDLLQAAIGLWRGPALTELAHVAPLAAWGRSLTEAWIEASDVLVDSALVAGDPATAVSVATAATAADPLREATAVLLVRALAAHGRAAEALRAAHGFRVRLAEETGLDPTPALAEVEQAVAAGDLSVGPTAGGTAARAAGGGPAGDGGATSVRVEPVAVPAPTAPLLGREAELDGLLRLVGEERVVTVVGPGGVGKTHLAMEVARRVAPEHTETHLLRLAPVADGAAVPTVLEGALGLDPGVGSGDPLARCALRLRPGRQLLVVDCCEHLLEAARAMVSSMVEACPDLTVLATSRERLALAVEQTCRLAPLAMPDPLVDADPGVDGEAGRVPSVALFLDRARRARPDLRVKPADLAAVARIVRSLDGMPLAIELAAGRLSSLSLTDLESRLDRALDLLGGTGGTGGNGGMGGDRHRTLRAAIEWSYDLLPAEEQRLFRSLAVFPDGVDLQTAEDVARDLGIAVDPVLALGHLVDASMVEADHVGPTRYRMLDTLRAFGLDRLEAADEAEAAAGRLVAWACRLAAWLLATVVTDDERLADTRLRAELANLRAAWRTARARGDLDAASAMIIDLDDVVAWRDVTEVWVWALELAGDPALAGHPSEGAVLAVAADATWFSTGDLDRAEALATRALELVDPEDERAMSVARWAMADVALFRGRFAQAGELGLASRAGSPVEAEGHSMAAMARAYAGDLDGAEADLERAWAAPASPTIRALVRYAEGEIAGRRGDWARAEAAYRAVLEVTPLTGARFLEGVASVGLVSALVAGGRTAEALAGFGDLLDRWERSGGWTQQWTTLRNLADLLDDLGDAATAIALRAAADRAPEAPALGPGVERSVPVGDGPVDREGVLDLARAAIARALGAGAGEVTDRQAGRPR